MRKMPKDYEIREIAPKIFVINEYNLTTMTVVLGSERALVIDVGDGVGDYKKVVESLVEGKPYDVYLTHGHVDHSGGRGQFEKIFMSQKDVAYLQESGTLLRFLYLFGMKFIIPTIPYRKARIKKGKEPVVNYVMEGDEIDLGDRHVEVLAYPGHTPGSLAYFVREEKVIIGGDAFNPGLFLFLRWARSVEEWIDSAKKYNERFLGTGVKFVPSHGFGVLADKDRADLLVCAENILKKHKKNTRFPIFAKEKKNGTFIIYRYNNVYKKVKK